VSRGVGWSWTWPYATALAAVAVATVAGQLWVRDWVVAGSCALTRCNPQSMAFVGWATLGPVTVFLVGLISAQLRTRAEQRTWWIMTCLVGLPCLTFWPVENDPWAGRTLHGPRDAALDAFGNGWAYAVAGIVVVGIGLFPAAMWQEARTYRRSVPA
jgi:hypothetical protein